MLFPLEFVVSQPMIKVIQSCLKQLNVLILVDWAILKYLEPTCRPEYLEGDQGTIKDKNHTLISFSKTAGGSFAQASSLTEAKVS